MKQNILFENEEVFISNDRFVIKQLNSTYFTKNISGCKVNRIDKPQIRLFIGLFMALIGILLISENIIGGILILLVAIILLYIYYIDSDSYTLFIQNNAGSIEAISSKNYKYIVEIQNYLISAINNNNK